MSVAALRTYEFAPKDTVDKFPAPLLYIGWEDHRMFCAPFCLPLPPTMKFGDLCTQALAGVYSAHPDFARIDWSQAQWFKSGQPWQPDPARTLAENGLGHKDLIRFRTPGLNGIGGAGV